ncbi:RHS domain-containing protein [Massilia antarctica]|uniref:RHS domain-containing protein n=1 Tax=Massilia antarctica TaxID=2765360 RepID=A0AA49ACG3_9BURK|nr:RHS domain-containing protein [Massilia antarctica]
MRERRYEYDATGNLTRIADERGGDLRYAYDPLGQLLSALREHEASETFAFDPAGNLLDPPSSKNSGTPHETEELRKEEAHFGEQARHGAPRLAKVTHNLLRQYAGHVYDYDARGNVIGKRWPAGDGGPQELALAYDSENRLITATRTNEQSRQVAHYTYDAFGRRIAKEVSEERREADGAARAVAVKTTLFVWDGDVLAQEIHADKTVTYLYEPDSFVPLARIESGEGIASYAPAGTYLCHINEWELPDVRNNPPPDLLQHEAEKAQAHRGDWALRQERADGNDAAKDRIHYYQCDHLGTPQELLDEHGVSVWSARYKAWGRIYRYNAKDVEQPLRFQGQYEDQETALYYNRNRYYDPDCGRYLMQDPIGLSGGFNLYQYAPNPVIWVDPTGLTKCNAKLTSKQARREVMRRAGIPTSSTPIAQRTPAGSYSNRLPVPPGMEQYAYEIRGDEGRRRIMIISHHQPDSDHACAHWHVGEAKALDENGMPTTFDHGSWKYQTAGGHVVEHK